jgi:hypothetical protein
LFDVFLFISILKLWLGSSKVVIGSGNVMIHSGILGIGPTRTVQFSQIAAFTMPVGMQSGGRSGAPFYDIKIRLNDGKEVKLASGIGNKLEAQWLISRMKSETGFKS